MKKLVEQIKRSKLQRFRTPAPLREDCFISMVFGIGAKQLYHTLWCVLSIGIHYDYCVAASCLLNVYQPDGDCPLVAKIAAQT